MENEVIGKMTLQEILELLKPGELCGRYEGAGRADLKEIAGMLSLPMGTVTWQYQNAMKKLRISGYEEF